MIKRIINFFKTKKQKAYEEKINKIKKEDPYVYWSEEEWDGDKLEIPEIKKGKK